MSSINPQTEMRQQLMTVFERADYPVTDPIELIPALPGGPATMFEAGDLSIGAMEIGVRYTEYQEYPYAEPEKLVDDLMTGLRDDGFFD